VSLSTTPRTWVAGETATAAMMNTEIRDAITGIQAAWTSFAPVLTASVTSPTMGTAPVVSGKYSRYGKGLVVYQFFIQFGTGAPTAGSGTYSISLPVTANAGPATAGNVRIFDGSTGNAGYIRPQVGTTTLALQYATTHLGPTAIVGAALPWVWAAGDILDGFVIYEAA
jgi:hypothetical protein